jgi:hypothetical protein
MKTRVTDGIVPVQHKASKGGSEKAPGSPSAGYGSSSGYGVTVKQVENLPTTGSNVRTPFVDRVRK